jgi:transcriptional regulator with XRE-family HTH domain
MDKSKLGEVLRKLRGNTPIEKVAEAAGVSISAMYMYEQGERVPRDEVKIKLAKYFNVSIEIFFAQ